VQTAAKESFDLTQYTERVKALGTPAVEAEDAAWLICRDL
jgi:hypothetical protein